MHTALITGASSGIGEALTWLFAKHGHDVVLVARSMEKLEHLAEQLEAAYPIRAIAAPADLARRGGVKKLATTISELELNIDVLVNSAGVMEYGFFVDLPTKERQRMIDLNVSGLTSMLHHFLPDMVERGTGRVLNVASISAFQPIPGLATYAATKAYVLSLTESVAEELAGTGVTITALCPSFTATPMLRDAQQDNHALKSIPGVLISAVDDVARQGYEACMRGDVISVPGTLNLATTLTGRALPRWLLRRISGAVGRYTANRR